MPEDSGGRHSQTTDRGKSGAAADTLLLHQPARALSWLTWALIAIGAIGIVVGALLT